MLGIEEIYSKYILDASADAHMEAPHGAYPQAKKTRAQRVSYRFIRHLYLTVPALWAPE